MIEERYVLATGDEGATRLRIVNAVHGPDTQAFLRRVGLAAGMRVADIGCGVGLVCSWIAEQVGTSGELIGVDGEAAQIAKARAIAAMTGANQLCFVQADAYATGLKREAFDLVTSRFLLMHVQRPADALAEMRSLLKPGGVLAVEDGDFTAPFCWPPFAAFDRCFALYRAIGARHGADFQIGQRLFDLVRNAGFREVQVALAQPVLTVGDAKRLPEWTLTESAPALIEAGLATQADLKGLAAEMAAFAAEESTLVGMARMMQVWARK